MYNEGILEQFITFVSLLHIRNVIQIHEHTIERLVLS